MPKDIYNMDAKLEKAVLLCKRELSYAQYRIILEYTDYCFAVGYKKSRVIKFLSFLKQASLLSGKTLSALNEKSLLHTLAEINQLPIKQVTRNDYVIILRGFFRWALRNKQQKLMNLLPLLKKKRCDDVRKPIKRIRPEDISALANAASSEEMKVLIRILWESGGRIQEILELLQSKVFFREDHASLLLNGKTGERQVCVVSCVPELRAWCEKRNGAEYVFTYDYAMWTREKLKLQKKLGLPELYAHLFRKCSATYYNRLLKESLVKKRYGWAPDSRMLKHYDFNDCEDANEAYLQIHRKESPRQDAGQNKLNEFATVALP